MLKIDVNVSCTSVQFSKINLRYIHSIFIRPRRTCALLSYYYEIMVSTKFFSFFIKYHFSFLIEHIFKSLMEHRRLWTSFPNISITYARESLRKTRKRSDFLAPLRISNYFSSSISEYNRDKTKNSEEYVDKINI